MSDSATLPHPIHQSITTPPSSLKIGDWGLKRPLPLRSTTKSSTPIIKVEAMDTFEHITEFGSAADHTLSLSKWQEMGIPIETPKVKREVTNFSSAAGSGKSVFEDAIDRTDYGQLSRESLDSRWKFGGPWLAGQTDGEFNEYVSTQVKKRKSGFGKFLEKELVAKRERVEAKALADAKAKAENEGTTFIAPQKTNLTREERAAQKGEQERQMEEQVEAYIKDLRQKPGDLFVKIRAFLDLPPVQVDKARDSEFVLQRVTEARSENLFPETNSPYGKTGPPKTHPSAGLSYLRTSSTLYNNPEFGPQRTPPPVEARIVMPKNSVGGFFGAAWGVGGFVVAPPIDNSYDYDKPGQNKNKQKKQVPGSLFVEVDKKGGSKVWVQPQYASVDPQGRVRLNVEHASDASVAVKQGTTDQLRPDVEPVRKVSPLGVSRNVRLDGKAGEGVGAAGYGLNFSA